jgi:hypothetical protein
MSDHSEQQIAILTAMVVAKVRVKLAVIKQVTKRFHMERFISRI